MKLNDVMLSEIYNNANLFKLLLCFVSVKLVVAKHKLNMVGLMLGSWLGNYKISKGERVMAFIASANRDPNCFYMPEKIMLRSQKIKDKYRTLSELIGKEKYIAFGNDQNDFIMLREAEISVFIGEREDFKEATYYASMNYIPTLINYIESKNRTKQEIL
jgi:hypothetical protein